MGLLSPLINDVTTDLDDPPLLVTGPQGPYPEGFKVDMRKRYASLRGVHIERPPAEVFARVCELAMVMPRWTIEKLDPDERTVYGIARTSLLRFKDDFAIRVRAAAEGEGAVVDMRSASRVGLADFGANAKRIRMFLAALSRAAVAP